MVTTADRRTNLRTTAAPMESMTCEGPPQTAADRFLRSGHASATPSATATKRCERLLLAYLDCDSVLSEQGVASPFELLAVESVSIGLL